VPGVPVTITGSATYEARSYTAANGIGAIDPALPIRYAEIAVYNSSGDKIQCGETDVNGDFSIQLPTSNSQHTIRVLSRADNNFLKASVLNCPEENDPYYISTTVTPDASKSVGTINADADNTGPMLGAAFNIYDQLLNANEFLRNEVGTCSFTGCQDFTVAPKVQAYWVKGFNPNVYFDNSSSGLSFYLPGYRKLYILGGISDDIYYSDTDHFDNSVILHEYGHFLEDIYSNTDSPGGQHSGNSIIDPRLAWSEGWGNFIQAAIRDESRYRDSEGTPNAASPTTTSSYILNIPIENPDSACRFDSNSSGCDIPEFNGEGQFREFSITRYLWDLFDTGAGGSTDGNGIPYETLVDIDVYSANGFALALDRNQKTIFRINLATGARTIISNIDTGAGTNFSSPESLSINSAEDTAYVVDSDLNALIEVNLANGNRTVIADDSTGTGVDLLMPTSVVVNAAESLVYVVDSELDALLSINLANGNRTIVSDDSTGTGTTFSYPKSISMNSAETIAYVLDSKIRTIFAVNLTTGNRTIVSDDSTGSGTNFESPESLFLNAAEDSLYLVDSDLNSVLLTTIASGNRTVISTYNSSLSTNYFMPSAIALNTTESYAYITDADVDAIIRLNLSTFTRISLTNNSIYGDDIDNAFEEIWASMTSTLGLKNTLAAFRSTGLLNDLQLNKFAGMSDWSSVQALHKNGDTTEYGQYITNSGGCGKVYSMDPYDDPYDLGTVESMHLVRNNAFFHYKHVCSGAPTSCALNLSLKAQTTDDSGGYITEREPDIDIYLYNESHNLLTARGLIKSNNSYWDNDPSTDQTVNLTATTLDEGSYLINVRLKTSRYLGNSCVGSGFRQICKTDTDNYIPAGDDIIFELELSGVDLCPTAQP
jgi:hypothetical protein